jgi:dCMP deaminase
MITLGKSISLIKWLLIIMPQLMITKLIEVLSLGKYKTSTYTKDISTLSDKWDKRYLSLAREISTWSKDPSSKIGAVAVGSQGQVLAQGYNGFPRGIKDSLTRLTNRETKLKYVVHAEENVIYNATFNGVSLNGSTIYVTGLPTCSDCAKGVIQVGIKRVVMPKQTIPDQWQDSWNLTQQMFKEAGVEYDFI